MNFVWFMFFSTIEGISVYALSLYVFRFDYKRYFWHSLLIIELINMQNYMAREELKLSFLAPLLNLVLTMLFFKTIVRVPVLWATFMTIVGYAAFLLLQTLIIFLSFGYFQVNEITEFSFKGHMVQLLTGMIGTFVGWMVYRRGFGFSFDFERIRLKWEDVFVIGLIIAFIIAFVAMRYFQDIVFNLFGFIVSLLVFLIYSIRKDASGN